MIGALELIEMLKYKFEGGTISGAINIPYTSVVDELVQLGCELGFDD
jgi:3-mercaptopyruvate sulfurtransferase SseA